VGTGTRRTPTSEPVDGHGVDASFEHDCSVAEMADFADATVPPAQPG